MKKLGTFCLLATIVLLLFTCKQDLMDINDDSDKLSSETVTNAESRGHTVVIYEDPDGPPETLVEVPGASSKLTRNANGITMSFKTKNLIPGNAYTVWFVIFGDDPGPPVLVTHAAGHVIGGSGKGNFSAHLSAGDIFDNPLRAEVHLALRTHGPAQPGMISDQIHTINGGCTNGYDSGPVLYPDDDVLGYCANIQVAMHPRVN